MTRKREVWQNNAKTPLFTGRFLLHLGELRFRAPVVERWFAGAIGPESFGSNSKGMIIMGAQRMHR